MPDRLTARRPRAAARHAASTALCLLACGLSGCAIFSGPERRPELLISPADALALGYSLAWSSDLQVREGDAVDHAVVLDDLIVVTRRRSQVATTMELRTGSVRWEQRISDGAVPLSRPLRFGDRLFFIVDGIQLQALDADTSALLERQDLDVVTANEPLLADGRVYVGGLNGRAVAHDLERGYSAWQYALTSAIRGAADVVDDRVLFADDRGTYAMLGLADGSLFWRGRVFVGVTADPVIADDAVLVPSEDGSLYALDRNTGRDLWVYRTATPLTRAARQIGRNVYLPVPGVATVALDAFGGEELWRSAPLDGGAMLKPLAAVDRGVLAQRGRELLIFDPDDGGVVESVQTVAAVQVVPAPGGVLLLVSDAGRVLRLDPRP